MLTRGQKIKRKLYLWKQNLKRRKYSYRREKTRLEYLEDRFFTLLKRLQLPLILIILIHYIGTVGYMLFADYPPLTALYQTFIGVTTIGYGEIIELDNIGRIFTMALDFAGIISYFYATGVIAELVFKEDILEIYREWKMLKEIQKLKNHYIIVGYNNISKDLIRFLRDRGYRVVLILDKETPELKRELEVERIKYYVIGHPYRKSTLYLANIKNAKGLITTYDNEAQNISVIATARLLRPKREEFEIIGIANSFETALKLKELGANHIIVPDHIVAGRIAALIFHPHTFVVADILEKIAFGEESEIDLAEFEILEGSPLEGKTLMELDLRKKYGVNVVAVKRGDGTLDMNLHGGTELYGGDVLILLGEPEKLEKAIESLSKLQEAKKQEKEKQTA